MPGSVETTPSEAAAPTAEQRRDRADRTISGLTRLLAERPELRGVHAPADLTDDALRWSA